MKCDFGTTSGFARGSVHWSGTLGSEETTTEPPDAKRIECRSFSNQTQRPCGFNGGTYRAPAAGVDTTDSYCARPVFGGLSLFKQVFVALATGVHTYYSVNCLQESRTRGPCTMYSKFSLDSSVSSPKVLFRLHERTNIGNGNPGGHEIWI